MDPAAVVKPKKARAIKAKPKTKFKSEAKVKEEPLSPVATKSQPKIESGPRLPSTYASKADIEASEAATLKFHASTVSLYTSTSEFGANHFAFEGKSRGHRAPSFR